MIRRPSALWTLPGSFQELLSRLGMILSVVGTIFSLGGLNPGSPTSSTDSPVYVVPDTTRQAELEKIRNDINLAIKQLRYDEQVPPVIMDPLHLQREAQRWAERAAVTGRLEESPYNVTMLQHKLPESGASGYAFLNAWLRSEEHTDALLDSRYSFYGIGVALGQGQVWVTVQFSA